MGDSENTEKYTPEELSEIERIVEFVTKPEEISEVEMPDIDESLENDSADNALDSLTEIDPITEDIDSLDELEDALPENLDFPDDLGLEDLSVDDTAVEDIPLDDLPDITSDITDLDDIVNLDDLGDVDEGTEDFAQNEENLEDIGADEIVDISDILTDVDEEPAATESLDDGIDYSDIGDLEDFSNDLTETDELSNIADSTDDVDPTKGSTLDQLDALTVDEPDSLDLEDLSDDQFVGGDELSDLSDIDSMDEPVSEIDLENIENFEDSEVDNIDSTSKEVSFDDDDYDVPNLDDISLNESETIPEVGDSDIPDFEEMDLGDIGGVLDSDSIDDSGDSLDEIGSIDDAVSDDSIMGDLDLELDNTEVKPDDEIESAENIDVGELDEIGDLDDLSSSDDISDIGDLGGIDDIDAGDESLSSDLDSESINIEPIDDDLDVIGDVESIDEIGAGDDVEPIDNVESAGQEGSLELTDKELKKLKKAILLFHPSIINEVKKCVINDTLPEKETRQLVDMIISGKPEDNIHRFLEKKLNQKITLKADSSEYGRRIITSRPEYTMEGRERQKKLLKLTKIFGAATISTIILSLLGYQFVYKPVMAKRKINEGTEIIRSAGDYNKKIKDYIEAENIFKYVNDNYKKDYSYGYNSYGRAYFSQDKYDKSIEKLNYTYTHIDKTDVDTLNNLGYYYARVKPKNYRQIKEKVASWYYGDKKKKNETRSQLEVSIDLYKRALLIEKDNVTTLYGIGNAYFYRGQYMNARKYYKDILALDDDSIIGYSGLLNLYIERNAFEQVTQINAALKERDITKDVESPLLGKLAFYYLSKMKSANLNVRIDYGIQSKRIKDDNDNLFPAIRYILKELNKRDADYPPLQIYWAYLHKADNNLLVMKRHLDKAVALSPNYFAALQMLGEYNYNIKRPDEAYRFLERGINSIRNGNQPKFTRDEFYKETETIGNSYTVMGNIFYYYFDKLKLRYGNVNDELIDQELEKMENYNIAKNYYEKAIKENYSSSELHYNLGRIYYMNRFYKKALKSWLHLYDDFVKQPELMFALGNAFYHLGNYEAGMGEYLKLISLLEYKSDDITLVEPASVDHIKIFGTLASANNNIGVLYQKMGDTTKSSIHYWKAVDYSKKLTRENEFARVNLARSLNKSSNSEPIIDEKVPYSIKYYKSDFRK